VLIGILSVTAGEGFKNIGIMVVAVLPLMGMINPTPHGPCSRS